MCGNPFQPSTSSFFRMTRSEHVKSSQNKRRWKNVFETFHRYLETCCASFYANDTLRFKILVFFEVFRTNIKFQSSKDFHSMQMKEILMVKLSRVSLLFLTSKSVELRGDGTVLKRNHEMERFEWHQIRFSSQ